MTIRYWLTQFSHAEYLMFVNVSELRTNYFDNKKKERKSSYVFHVTECLICNVQSKFESEHANNYINNNFLVLKFFVELSVVVHRWIDGNEKEIIWNDEIILKHTFVTDILVHIARRYFWFYLVIFFFFFLSTHLTSHTMFFDGFLSRWLILIVSLNKDTFAVRNRWATDGWIPNDKDFINSFKLIDNFPMFSDLLISIENI